MGGKLSLVKKNWLIGIVVVAALGVLVYLGTNTDLLKGSLGKGGEKGGTPVVNLDRCILLKQWYKEGKLTENLKGNMDHAIACAEYFQKIWFGKVSLGKCKQFKHWLDETNLTPNLAGGGKVNGAYQDFNECVTKYAKGNASGTWKFPK